MIKFIIIYWVVCAVIAICIYFYSTKNDPFVENSPISLLLLILIAPLVPPLLPIIIPYYLFIKFYEKPKEKMRSEKWAKEREIKENEIKAKVGLRPDENYVCFSRLGGAGTIKCEECGHEEEIICFTHGFNSAEIGRQCPNCHAFVVEHNESEKYHEFGAAKEDFTCPKCGTIIRKKEESIFKGNDDPLICPKCQSPRLHYKMTYIT